MKRCEALTGNWKGRATDQCARPATGELEVWDTTVAGRAARWLCTQHRRAAERHIIPLINRAYAWYRPSMD